MAYRDPATLHIDTDLTNISAGFEGQAQAYGYIAGVLAPPVRVSDKSDKYRVYDRSSWGHLQDDKRAPGGRANEIPPMKFSRQSYYTHEHALVDVVPIEDSRADPDADAQSTERVTNSILLGREKALIDMVTTTSNYDTGFTVTLSGTSQWSDYTNSSPITDFRTGQKAIHDVMFMMPNTVIFGWNVWRTLEQHPKVLDRLSGGATATNPAVATREAITAIFGLPQNITIAENGYVSSDYGLTEATSYLWPNDVLLAYVPPAPGKRIPAFVYEFVRPVGADDGEVMPTERTYDWDRKANKIRVSREYDFRFITTDAATQAKSSGAAYLIHNAI